MYQMCLTPNEYPRDDPEADMALDVWNEFH